MAARSPPQSTAENPVPLPGGPEPAVKRPVLWLESVTLSGPWGRVLHAADAVFGAGELALVEGAGRRAGRLLAELLSGRREADGGSLRRATPAAPLVPSDWGFEPGVAIEDGLSLRAAAYGLDRQGYIDAVAGLLDDRGALGSTLPGLGPEARAVVTFAGGYLVPASLYVVLGPPLPALSGARRRLAPLLRRAREEAAVICILDQQGEMGQVVPDRRFRLSEGKLVGCTGAGVIATPAGPTGEEF